MNWKTKGFLFMIGQACLVEIFADGACKGNPGPGGWGAILRFKATQKEIFGGEVLTTNNRMELQAVIAALTHLTKKPCDVVITTDSRYVQKGMSEWIVNWKRKNWRTASGSAVKNIDLWQQLDCLVGQHNVQWHWIKSHSGHSENERADYLANCGIPTSQAY